MKVKMKQYIGIVVATIAVMVAWQGMVTYNTEAQIATIMQAYGQLGTSNWKRIIWRDPAMKDCIDAILETKYQEYYELLKEIEAVTARPAGANISTYEGVVVRETWLTDADIPKLALEATIDKLEAHQ